MFTTRRIDSIEARLQSYQDQMVALSEALGALRALADTIVSELATDAATVRDLAPVALPPMDSAAIAEADAECQTGGSNDLPLAATSDATAVADVAADVASALASITTSDAPALDSAEVAAPAPITNDVTVALDAIIKAHATESSTAAVVEEVTATTATATTETPAASTNVIDLAASRSKKAKPTPPARSRHAVGIVASLLLVASASVAVQGVINTDIGQRLLDLGACDADMLSANRDCALLAWLLL